MSSDQLGLFDAASARPPRRVLPDEDARNRIRTDLSTNLLVEAGAGAGKTTEMVHRMVALVRTGTARVDEIAAVTFTRKAAAELRERFQTALERELRAATRTDTETTARLDAALRQIDRAFLGTIHAFCARLLRERPLDAGLDPAFRETLGAEEVRFRRDFWHAHIERLAAEGDDSLAGLRAIGLSPPQLLALFEELAGQPDVDYHAPPADRPDASLLRRRIESIMNRAATHMPRDEPRGGWDSLQTTLRMLRFHRFVLGWSDDARFLDIVAELRPSSVRATRNRWPDGDAAREIEGELRELLDDGGAVQQQLRQWWAYRYPIVIAFARTAAAAYERERLRAGTLNFQDLLMFAARLLRESPAARRELSDRYRFLLVDEFQDTDPIQAEVLFLLASDEELDLFADTPAAAGADGWRQPFAAWRHLTPRPGALFVVGDPKQSIYRFRRADMTLYQQVKRRFEAWSGMPAPAAGGVVELIANFRSRKPIEIFVNANFERRFPAHSTDEQASYAPMLVQPPDPDVDGDGSDGRSPPEGGRYSAATSGAVGRPADTAKSPQAGVFWYELEDPVHARVPYLARQDSERVATWIAARVAKGERRPGDFLLLTPNTKWLARYAAALEARNIPVQVTGAGVGGPDRIELEELRLLLRALADPADGALAVAVLIGLFFGADYEQLTRHAELWAGDAAPQQRPPFSFAAVWPEPATEVEQALALLHEFWLLTRRLPADIAVPEIVDRLGILPFAAAGELGESRAGALLFALDAIRAAATSGDASLSGAIAALDAALDEGDSEAPLEPGRRDVVRVMNLHKAKGLEANVVVLAMPFGEWSPPPASRVVRDGMGRALGFATITEAKGPNRMVTLAQPADWDEHEEAEQRFARAESQRLLYVAATRAAHELVVGCAYNARSPSPWRSFYPWLQQHAQRLDLPQPARGERIELAVPGVQLLDEAAAVARARAVHARPGYRVAAVTSRKREGAAVVPAPAALAADIRAAPDHARRGTDWGTAVHDALLYAAQGMSEERLRQACRNRLIALDRPLDDAGEPAELHEVLAVVAAVLASELWRRAAAAPERLVEVPFAVPFTAAEYAAALPLPVQADTGAAGEAHGEAPIEVVDGRIDLVFRDAGGWVIVDYKTDAAGPDVAAGLLRQYLTQLMLYAASWERLTAEPVTEAVLLFTASGQVVHARGGRDAVTS
jgi:ATP-dependent helicase/nuclease subunit A